MPVFAPGTSYTNLNITPPVGLRMVIPKSNLQGAMSEIGQTVTVTSGSTTTTATVAQALWGLQIYVTPPNAPTGTPSLGIEVDLIYNGQQFLLQVIIGSYYVTSPITLQYNYPLNPTSLTDAIIDIYFQGNDVYIYGNGQLLFNTNMLKGIGAIQQLTSDSTYISNTGATISGLTNYLSYNVQQLYVLNVSQILDIVIPLAVVSMILSLLPKVLTKLKIAK